MKPTLLTILFTLVSGLGDAQGFVYAARIWQPHGIAWGALGRSALGFAVGMTCYWLTARYAGQVGIIAPELQTLLWFSVTIIGVAALSGAAWRWQRTDQLVALAVLAGVGWLLARVGG